MPHQLSLREAEAEKAWGRELTVGRGAAEISGQTCGGPSATSRGARWPSPDLSRAEREDGRAPRLQRLAGCSGGPRLTPSSAGTDQPTAKDSADGPARETAERQHRPPRPRLPRADGCAPCPPLEPHGERERNDPALIASHTLIDAMFSPHGTLLSSAPLARKVNVLSPPPKLAAPQ